MTAQSNVIQLKEETNYTGQSLFQLAMRRLRRDRLTILAAIVVTTLTLLSILAPFISNNILRVDYGRTNTLSAFVPPGGVERLAFLPDYRYVSQSLHTVVLYDRGREVKEIDIESPASKLDIAAAPNNGILQFAQVAQGAPLLDLYLNDETKPALTRLDYGQFGSAPLSLPAGSYRLTLRETGKPATEAPLLTLDDVAVSAGQVVTAVSAGRFDAQRAEGLRLNTFAAGLADIKKGRSRLQVIHLSENAANVNVIISNRKVYGDLTRGSSAIIEVERTGLQSTGIAAVDARTHVLGTDDLGRDHLARLLYAGQVSLGIGFFAASISIVIGVTLGVITGFYGGIIDDLMNWFITTLTSLPTLLLLLIIVAVFNPSPLTLILVLGLLGWTGTCRLVRGETLSIRAREYIVSARAIGAPVARIMFVHILPNLFSVVIISMMLDIGSLILTESALSFLGFGIKDPASSWGQMLSNSQTFFTKGGYLVVFPGLLISITVLCLFVIGDGLRDAFDPTIKN